MLKALKQTDKEKDCVLVVESRVFVTEEDMINRAAELSGLYAFNKEEPSDKTPSYKDRWKDRKRDELETQDENFECYQSKVKDQCFICGASIEKSLDTYVKQGNSCDTCNDRVNRVVKNVITHQEAMEELLLTRKI